MTVPDALTTPNVDVPVTPRVPPTVASPMIPAFASTSKVSMCAVPSRNKSFHSNVDVPRSLAPSVDGTRSLSKRPVTVTVSLVAFPISTLPLNVEPPVTVRFPVIPAFSSTVRVSIFAVPSMNRSCHSLSDVPRSLVPSAEGTRSLSKRPVAVIVSLVAFPRSTLPSIDAFPETVRPVRVPTFVREEFTTADPRVVALNVSTLFTLYTLPDATFRFSEDPKLSPVASNWNVLLPSPDSIVIPPPLAAASLAAPFAIRMFLSVTSTVVELTVVVVPSTWKSPAITTLPVLSPTPAGSRVIVAGPEIVSEVTLIADPSAPVWNAEPVTVLEAFTVPVTPNCDPLNVRFPESSSSPDVPARTTLPSVRSEIAAELATKPPAILAPPSASIAPLTSTVPVNVETPDTLSCVASTNATVVIPVTFIALKLAPCPPPRT